MDRGPTEFWKRSAISLLVLTYPGHLELPSRKALQKKIFSYIAGRVHLCTPGTGDELWEGGERAESGQHGRLYITEGLDTRLSNTKHQGMSQYHLCRNELGLTATACTFHLCTLNMTISLGTYPTDLLTSLSLPGPTFLPRPTSPATTCPTLL